jgi:hypothetical protein
MKQAFFSIAVVVLSALLPGCIYESALESKPPQKIDQRFLGDWQHVEDPNNRMLICAFNQREYAIVTTDEKSIACYRAFTSDVNGLHLASVQGLEPGEPQAGKWAIFEYRLDASARLVIRMINDKVISPSLKTPRELRKAIREHQDNPALFLKESVYAKFKG